jgi:hypothetical protein
MRKCQDTVVNWLLLRNNFVILHVRPVLIGAINPLFKKKHIEKALYACMRVSLQLTTQQISVKLQAVLEDPQLLFEYP